jgi:hypothetical protein
MGLLFTDSDLLYRGVLYRQWFVTMSCPFKTHLTVFCSDWLELTTLVVL